MTRATLVILVDDDDRAQDGAAATPWTATLRRADGLAVDAFGGGVGATPLEAVADLLTMLEVAS